MERNHGDGGTSMTEFAQKHGYFPATVEDAEKRSDGWTLITTGKDKDADIMTFFDERSAVRRGEFEADAAE